MDTTLCSNSQSTKNKFWVLRSDNLRGTAPNLLSIGTSTADRLFIYRTGASVVTVVGGGVYQVVSIASKLVLSYTNDTLTASVGGTIVFSVAFSFSFPGKQLRFLESHYGGDYTYGTMRSFTYYPRAFDALALQRLSRIQ